jgi:hypothetical protein
VKGRGAESAWLRAAGVLGVGAVLLAAHLKILTYVTGQDPFTYARLGMDLLQGGVSAEALREVADFIVPGYPLMLAGVARWLGPYASAWVGFVFTWGALAGLLHVGRRRGLGPWGALLMGWTFLWLAWRIYPMHAHFLLYAFRGAPQLCAMVWAFALAEGSEASRRSGVARLALASVVLLAGALVRETALLALPGLAAWVVLAPEWRGARGRGLAALAAPPLLVALAGAAVAAALGWGGNLQARTWWNLLAQMDVGAWGRRLWDYAGLAASSGGWVGGALFAAGIGLRWRRPQEWVPWILPALLLAAFYAVFMVHRRYALDSYLLLATVAAGGAAFAVEAAARRLPTAVGRGLLGGALAAALALNVLAIRRLPPWEQQVSRAQVRQFVRTTDLHVPDRDRTWTDRNCRYLIEAAWTYLGVNPIAKWDEFPGGLDEKGWYYWQRADRGGDAGIWSEEIIRRFADVEPALDEFGEPVGASLGTLSYSLYRVVPWRHLRVEKEWTYDPNGPPVIWLDLRESAPDARRVVRLAEADGAEVQRWTMADGNGLAAVWVDASRIERGGRYRVSVESDRPIPSAAVLGSMMRSVRSEFTLATGRLPSAMGWLEAPVRRGYPEEKWGATFVDEANFSLPLPQGMPDGKWVCEFFLEPRHLGGEDVVFRYERDGEAALSATNRLERYRIGHAILLEAPFAASRAKVHLRASVPDEFDNHFRIVSLGFRTEPAAVAH